MGPLLDDYAAKAALLDDVLTELTKGFCADSCPKGDVHCCDTPFLFRSGILLDDMLHLQEREPNGLTDAEEDMCQYHSGSGCSLTCYKPPICLGHICYELEDSLVETYGRSTHRFIRWMWKLEHSRLDDNPRDGEKLLHFMEKAIETGNGLIQKKRLSAQKETHGLLKRLLGYV